jgi:carboxymethylenebutenolidase
MKEHNKDFQALVYPGVGHAFFNDTNPHAYNASVALDAWNKSLAFLRTHVET